MKILVTFLIIIVTSFPAYASLEIGGYYKNEFNITGWKSKELTLGDLNKLRLKFDASPNPAITAHAEVEYKTYHGDRMQTLTGTITQSHNLDRAYVRIYLPYADLTFGKQRIAWGTGYIWNPTDILNPFFLIEPEEEKPGIGAVRVEIPLGVASGFDLVFSPGSEGLESSIAAIKGKTNIGVYDFSASYVSYGPKKENVVGFDTAGDFFELGVRFEGTHTTSSDGSSYAKYIAGADYTFKGGLNINLEYYYTGLGKLDTSEYDWDSLFSGQIYHLAREYVYFGVGKDITELMYLRGGVIYNLTDQSYIVYPSYSYNIFTDTDLMLEALLLGGEEGSEYNPYPAEDPTGLLGGSVYFIKLRVSF